VQAGTGNCLSANRLAAAADKLILSSHQRPPVPTRRTNMGKIRQSNKEAKKQAALTPKEKKAAKQAEKNTHGVAPLVQR
jgi:hypothetical protein